MASDGSISPTGSRRRKSTGSSLKRSLYLQATRNLVTGRKRSQSKQEEIRREIKGAGATTVSARKAQWEKRMAHEKLQLMSMLIMESNKEALRKRRAPFQAPGSSTNKGSWGGSEVTAREVLLDMRVEANRADSFLEDLKGLDFDGKRQFIIEWINRQRDSFLDVNRRNARAFLAHLGVDQSNPQFHEEWESILQEEVKVEGGEEGQRGGGRSRRGTREIYLAELQDMDLSAKKDVVKDWMARQQENLMAVSRANMRRFLAGLGVNIDHRATMVEWEVAMASLIPADGPERLSLEERLTQAVSDASSGGGSVGGSGHGTRKRRSSSSVSVSVSAKAEVIKAWIGGRDSIGAEDVRNFLKESGFDVDADSEWEEAIACCALPDVEEGGGRESRRSSGRGSSSGSKLSRKRRDRDNISAAKRAYGQDVSSLTANPSPSSSTSSRKLRLDPENKPLDKSRRRYARGGGQKYPPEELEELEEIQSPPSGYRGGGSWLCQLCCMTLDG